MREKSTQEVSAQEVRYEKHLVKETYLMTSLQFDPISEDFDCLNHTSYASKQQVCLFFLIQVSEFVY